MIQIDCTDDRPEIKLKTDNDGDAFGDQSGELKHYNVEYGPAAVSN